MDMFTHVKLKEVRHSFSINPYVDTDKEKLTEFDSMFAGYKMAFKDDVKKELESTESDSKESDQL